MVSKEISDQIGKEKFAEKIKQIRSVEKFTRAEFSLAINVPPDTVKGIEQAKHGPSFKFISSITGHPIFRKYTLWLLCEPWDEEDHDNDTFPIDVKQTTPDLVQLQELQKKLGLNKT